MSTCATVGGMRHTGHMTYLPEWRATDTESPHETRDVPPGPLLAYLRLPDPTVRPAEDPAHALRRAGGRVVEEAAWSAERGHLPDDVTPGG